MLWFSQRHLECCCAFLSDNTVPVPNDSETQQNSFLYPVGFVLFFYHVIAQSTMIVHYHYYITHYMYIYIFFLKTLKVISTLTFPSKKEKKPNNFSSCQLDRDFAHVTYTLSGTSRGDDVAKRNYFCVGPRGQRCKIRPVQFVVHTFFKFFFRRRKEIEVVEVVMMLNTTA